MEPAASRNVEQPAFLLIWPGLAHDTGHKKLIPLCLSLCIV
jgi:hypothetical protein